MHTFRPAFRIVGYVYEADTYCPTCLIETLIARGEASPAARDMAAEDVLDQVAGANGIADRFDETTFDSSEHPKVIFASESGGCSCARCGEGL